MEMKKRQFVVFMLKGKDLQEEDDGKVHIKFKREHFNTTSATLELRQLERLEKKYNISQSIESLNKAFNKKEWREIKADSFVKLVTIDWGNTENQEMITQVCKEGFYTKRYHYVLVEQLGGSHHKQVKQFYVREEINKEFNEVINLKETTHTIVPKRLTSNALLSTSIWEIPYSLDMLNVCILPDNEIEKVFENKLETLVPYTYKDMNEIEKLKYDTYEEYKQIKQAYSQVKKDKKDEISKLKLKVNHTCYKTPYRWLTENNRLVMLEEISEPQYRNHNNIITYSENQTIEIDERITGKELLEVDNWSLVYKVEDYNGKLPINNFDGMGLISSELGTYIRDFLQDYKINGCQLRIPQMKGFYPIVNFKKYLTKKGIRYLYDMFGYKWRVEDINIIATESTFKAKLEADKEGIKPIWMWKSYQEYQSRIVELGYDCIGIANTTHKRDENEYRQLTYQFLETLNATEYDLLALAQEQGTMLYNVLKIYRENREANQEINWEDIKYIKCYLNELLKENDEDNYVETAIKCIDLNKNMIFDRKFTSFLFSNIKRELDEMGLAKIKVKSNYLYMTTDILGFLKYVSLFGNDKCKEKDYRDKISKTEVEGILKENEWFCEGVTGNKVMYRNPLMAQSEIFKPIFVDLSENEDYKYIKHLDNIIQAPMNTYAFQKATFDVDGDKMQLIHLDHNLKEYNLDWLISYDFLSDQEVNRLDILKNQMNLYFEIRFKDKKVVTLSDLIFDDNKIIVNPSDGATILTQEWNLDNIVDFIVKSNDQTGIITDFNTIALNRYNSITLQDWFASLFEDIYKESKQDEKFNDYKYLDLTEEEIEKQKEQLKLTNKYCKFFQGVIIDASKRGIVPEIAENLSGVYKLKPQFYLLKGKDKNQLDKDYKSHLDRYYKKMVGLKGCINKLFNVKVPNMITEHQLYFTSNLIQNPKINNLEELNKVQEKLKPIIEKYGNKANKLIQQKSSINQYSKNDKAKAQRKKYKEKWSKLIKKTKKRAYKSCNNSVVLAQAVWGHVYSGKSEAFSSAWVIGAEGFIYNLQQNQTEKYNVSFAEEDATNTFAYLGKKYKLTIDNKPIFYQFETRDKKGEVILNNEGEKVMVDKFEIDKKYIKDTYKDVIENVELKFVSYKAHYKDDKENYLQGVIDNLDNYNLVLIKNDIGLIQLADKHKGILCGISVKENGFKDNDVINKEGWKVNIKEIERLYNKQDELVKTAFDAKVDLISA